MHFEMLCGSVIGGAHRRAGRNGQDGFALERDTAGRMVMVVTDGCGSARHSEVGAKLGASVVAREILAQAGGALDWQAVAGSVVARLGAIAAAAQTPDIHEHFLFTVVGALITAEETVIFHAGDGLFAVNGVVRQIGPYAGNAPPYLAYALAGGVEPAFTVAHRCETAAVESILIATDGAEPLLQTGELAKMVRVPSNPDAIRRRLFLITRAPGSPLEDDTTVAVARRVA